MLVLLIICLLNCTHLVKRQETITQKMAFLGHPSLLSQESSFQPLFLKQCTKRPLTTLVERESRLLDSFNGLSKGFLEVPDLSQAILPVILPAILQAIPHPGVANVVPPGLLLLVDKLALVELTKIVLQVNTVMEIFLDALQATLLHRVLLHKIHLHKIHHITLLHRIHLQVHPVADVVLPGLLPFVDKLALVELTKIVLEVNTVLEIFLDAQTLLHHLLLLHPTTVALRAVVDQLDVEVTGLLPTTSVVALAQPTMTAHLDLTVGLPWTKEHAMAKLLPEALTPSLDLTHLDLNLPPLESLLRESSLELP